MFVALKKDGGWHPIINLRKLNAFLSVSYFKMENINSVRDVIQEDNYMGKIDLKDAYLTVPVWEKHHKYILALPLVEFQSHIRSFGSL